MGEKGNAPSAAQHAASNLAPAAPRQVASRPTPAGPADQHAAPHLQAPTAPSGAADGGTAMPPVVMPLPDDRDPDQPGD